MPLSVRSSSCTVRARAVAVFAWTTAVVFTTWPAIASGGACWTPPVAAPVTDPYREPACAWCPGNRGLEYGTRDGARVTAVAAGEVTFAGAVAATRYVVVRHGDGLRVTYGNLQDVRVQLGDRVLRGALVGLAAGAFHLGLRDGDRYVDPAPFIGELRGVIRLIPADGSAPAPAPAPRLVCAAQR